MFGDHFFTEVCEVLGALFENRFRLLNLEALQP